MAREARRGGRGPGDVRGVGGVPRTVRSKLTLLATALVAGVLVASGLALVATQERVLTHGIDESLRQRADNLAPLVREGLTGPALPAEGDPEDSFIQVVSPDGRVRAASANAAGLGPVAAPLPAGGTQRIVTVADVPLLESDFRVLRRLVPATPGGGAAAEGQRDTLVVAKNLDDVIESVEILTTSLAISIPVVTGLLALLVWWLTGRVLRPVETIRAEVAGMPGDQLHRRLPAPATQDEIAALARTMNAMLDRVEQATERQRRFVADASHELRGPLTRLRSALEVALAHPDGEPRATYAELLADTVELQKLVDDLLFLARSESGALEPAQDPVDLDDLVLAQAARLRRHGRVSVDVRGVAAARTCGDAAQLGRALQNLADNAERHARSTVAFSVRETGDRCELVVADDGPGIPAEHRQAVFTRFTRLDEARSRDDGGSGLGLAIVHDIVTRHRGRVTVTDNHGAGSGARLVVSLPLGE